jgi:integrase
VGKDVPVATLVKTAQGKWKSVIRRRGWPTVAKTFRTKRDAQDWGRATEDEMVRGVFVNRASSHRLSVRVALARYGAEVTPTKRNTTQYREKGRIKMLGERLGDYSLVSLTPEIVSAFRDTRLAEGKSANTVRLELAVLSNLFTIAMREWRLGLNHNPVTLVRKPSAPHRERRLAKAEAVMLLAECDKHANPMLGWIVRVALHTGMRLGEIVSLRVDQIDLDRRVLRLTQTKNGTSRTVPLTRAATEVFAAALANPLRPKETDLVFGEPGRTGKRSPYRFEKVWNGLKKRINLADLHFHDLRHEAVSRFVEMGLSDQEVSAISGHKSMQMLKRYTHLRAEDLVERLDRSMG